MVLGKSFQVCLDAGVPSVSLTDQSIRPEPDREEIQRFYRPLLGCIDGQLQINCAATFVGGNSDYPLTSDAPDLSSQKRHALQALQDAAQRVCVKIEPRPGDMLFVNNYALMHARDAWLDSTHDSDKQRFVMRLWLHDDNKGWRSAPGLKRRMDSNFDLPPEKQGLRTFHEWQSLPRSHRVKAMGVSAHDCHD